MRRKPLKVFMVHHNDRIGLFRYTWNQGPSGSSGSDVRLEAMDVDSEGEITWTPIDAYAILADHSFKKDYDGRAFLFDKTRGTADA